jgi:hypothetical protein
MVLPNPEAVAAFAALVRQFVMAVPQNAATLAASPRQRWAVLEIGSNPRRQGSVVRLRHQGCELVCGVGRLKLAHVQDCLHIAARELAADRIGDAVDRLGVKGPAVWQVDEGNAGDWDFGRAEDLPRQLH